MKNKIIVVDAGHGGVLKEYHKRPEVISFGPDKEYFIYEGGANRQVARSFFVLKRRVFLASN
jgi:hypothetical protein